MTPCIKFILCFLPVIGFSQVVDFENLPNLNPEDPVGVITLVEEDYNIQFYMGHSIQETIPLISIGSLFTGFNGKSSGVA